MSKRIVLASIATMLAMGGLAYGVSGFTGKTEPCPWEGTPACPKVASAQATAQGKTVASADLPPCCKAKANR